MITFHIVARHAPVPSSGFNVAYLRIDHWNDYSFVTMFDVVAYDEVGERLDLSTVKIGFAGQIEAKSTAASVYAQFSSLPPTHFSVGQEPSYYVRLAQASATFREAFLTAMRDVAFDRNALDLAREERVFRVSLLRTVSLATIEEQYPRILRGGAQLTDFNFTFEYPQRPDRAGYRLAFEVKAGALPPTNIHAVIGRNGVGKTSLLNGMTRAIMAPGSSDEGFETKSPFGSGPIGRDYFSSLISISFSVFDPFSPPAEQPDPSKGTCYFYVGFKDLADEDGAALLKPLKALYEEFVESVGICLSQPDKRRRWLEAIATLETDDNFANMSLSRLAEVHEDQVHAMSTGLLRRMSSGHAVVLLSITKLVARLEEKSLVLFDEPESHLHPPLLSALIRSLGKLLVDRNAVAIIATHSPVVLQEVPKSCVWKINRSGLASTAARPDVETFGENVGLLTREVFGLEVSRSGFSAMIADQAAQPGASYDDVLRRLSGQLGLEGRAILRAVLTDRAGS